MPKRVQSHPDPKIHISFDIGDEVKAVPGAPYAITKDGWKGHVTKKMKPSEHPQGCDVQVDGFDVHSKDFVLSKKGDGKLFGNPLLLVFNDSGGALKIAEYWKMQDIETALQNLSRTGGGFNPATVCVYEVKQKNVKVDVSVSIKEDAGSN